MSIHEIHTYCNALLIAQLLRNLFESFHYSKETSMKELSVEDVDYKDKRVAVIGTGSSAIQIIPQVQKGGAAPRLSRRLLSKLHYGTLTVLF